MSAKPQPKEVTNQEAADADVRESIETFEQGQTLIGRRDLLRRSALAGGAIAAGGAASSGTAAAQEDYGAAACETNDYIPCAGDGVRWLFDKASGLFSSGYDKSDVEDMVAENQHWEIFESLENAERLLHGFHVETDNWTVPSDPSASALADLAWGEARAYTFRQIEEHGDVNEQDTIDGAIAEANEYLSIVAQNYLRQWNEFVWIIYRHVLTFSDNIEEHDPDHTEGETPSTTSINLENGTTPEGLSTGDVFRIGSNAAQFVSIDVNEYTLPNGETEEYYSLRYSAEGTSDEEVVSVVDVSNGGANSGFEIEAESPEADRISVLEAWPSEGQNSSSEWGSKIHAVESVESQINGGDLDTYISDVLVDVRQGDLEGFDILSPADYAREFGDSSDITRLDAEMHALGLQSPEENRTDVTLSWTDEDGNDHTQTGSFYVSWDWSEMNSWEYEYDSGALELTLDEDSLMDHTIYTAIFDDSGTEVTVDFIVDDLEDGTYSFGADNGTLQTVRLDAEGDLNSFIPEGETFTVGSDGDAGMAYLGYTDEEDQVVRESLSGYDVTLEDSGTDEDRTTLTGYNTKTRDPARALDQARHYDEQRQDTTDLEEAGGWTLPSLFDGGGGGLLLIGAGVLAYLGLTNDN